LEAEGIVVGRKKKAVMFVLLSTAFLCACSQPGKSGQTSQSDSRQKAAEQVQSEEPAFERPKDQYGLKYWVGNLGGKPVKLPPTIFTVWEYDDSPDTWGGTKEEMAEYKKRPRTYDSIIKSMSFEMRFTDGMFLERYYKAPQTSAEQYETENNLQDSHWLRIQFESGQRYGVGDMNIYWRNIMSRPKDSSMAYHPTNKKVYGLKEYKLNNLSVHGGNEDLYVYSDQNNNVTTVIYCYDSTFGGGCEQEFLLLPTLKTRAIVNYQRIHLRDWKLIQQRVSESIQPYIINSQ